MRITVSILLVFIFWSVKGQEFKRISGREPDGTDSIQLGRTATYAGAAFVDVNEDGYLDLSAAPGYLLINDRQGHFQFVPDAFPGSSNPESTNCGVTWADFDNDGHLDVCIAGYPTQLYRGLGNGNFERVEQVLFATDSIPAWGAVFGDINGDAWIDLVTVYPDNFVQGAPSEGNRLLLNDHGIFREDRNYTFTTGAAPYTVGTIIDFDEDGDFDLFFGTGPGGPSGYDSIYINRRQETHGEVLFSHLSGYPFTDSLQNGQVYSFIDLDNDLDLDLFLTNWQSVPNRLYRNEDGHFVEESSILSKHGTFLSPVWGDFDNDAELDLILVQQVGLTELYLNDGVGKFTRYDGCYPLLATLAVGGTAGDIDRDGDLDLYLHSRGVGKALYENVSNNGNHWIQLDLEGTASNRAAIGAKVSTYARLHGTLLHQRRDVSACNTFNGHNALRQHFGLGEATRLDSIVVDWPSGIHNVWKDVPMDQILSLRESDPAQGQK